MDDGRRPSGWDLVRERQRRAVRDAMIALVADGSDCTVIADVCSRAGISRPTFYRYYPTVGAALLDVYRSIVAELEAGPLRGTSAEGSGRELLLARYAAVFAYLLGRVDLVRFTTFVDHGVRRTHLSPEERRELVAMENRRPDQDIALLRRGREDASIRDDLDPETVITALASSVAGLIDRLLATDRLDDAASPALDALLAAWDAYLAPRP